MTHKAHIDNTFDEADSMSIFEYSRHLIGKSLHELFGDSAVEQQRKGKGGLGQMVEELFFKYGVNSKREADFEAAHVELKCTPLLESADGYRIKERLVCTMIDYFEIVKTPFEKSHLVSKSALMLLLFYLHVNGLKSYDYRFLFRVLWQLPQKDLEIIKNDYLTIAEKVRRGEAHLLSEGDTLYLGACRKGQKNDKLQAQPNSDIKAKKRAFSLKPAYMRYVLSHVVDSGNSFFTNYNIAIKTSFELVAKNELDSNSFEDIIKERFQPFMGLNYCEVCQKFNLDATQSKNKYADISSLIASKGQSKRLNNSEEFEKSGITMKTIRLNESGMPKESMSFKNIDYCEIAENDEWTDSELYELFTNRFMFVVFKPEKGKSIDVLDKCTGLINSEQSFILDSIFFWTMPAEDLETAEEFWENIRMTVLRNEISTKSFWRISDKRKFHVRPKARLSSNKTINPNGGMCDKLSYWMNAEYVKNIIENHGRTE